MTNNLRKSRKAQRLSLLLAPVVATSVLAASPSKAATLSFSQAELTISDLTAQSSFLDSLNEADTDAISKDENAPVEVINSPAAVNITNKILEPIKIETFAISEAFGQNKDYLGTGNTNAKIVGNFDVAQGEQFAFSFEAFVDLETRIDTPSIENAQARAEVGFWLFDTTGLNEKDLENFSDNLFADTNINFADRALEYFTLGANLNTLGNDDNISSNKSDNIFLNVQEKVVDFEEDNLNEFTTALFQGSLERTFDKESKLTLFATRRTQVRVAAPEPSTSLALLISGALAAIASNYKRKKTHFTSRNQF
ncbi:MAG: PEP-CTERM sorting domain-containing protein [Calothrix sp. MO_167.B12]|nr:PEP-CTERM sorting domain-containing protein [Calothrix sp. MO_167.B12]